MPPPTDALVRPPQVISKYLPKDNPRLSPAVYEMVLHHFLQEENPQVFLKTIREWPPVIYNTHVIISAVNDRLKTDPTNAVLQEALAELCVHARGPRSCRTTRRPVSPCASGPGRPLPALLCGSRYTNDRQYDKALQYLLQLGRSNVFELIRKAGHYVVAASVPSGTTPGQAG